MTFCTRRFIATVASVLPLLLMLSCGGDIVGPGSRVAARVMVAADPVPRFFVGESLQLRASFEDSKGQPVTGTPVTWAVLYSETMQVSATGVVTATEPGIATVSATIPNGSGATIQVQAYPAGPPLHEPSSFSARPVSNVEIQMAWRGGNGFIETFQVERELVGPALQEGEPTEAAAFGDLVAIPDTAYGDFDVVPNQTYRYRVRSCNRHGCSAYSGIVAATTYPTLAVETESLPVGHVGEAYSVLLDVTPGTGVLAWSLAEGALPDGMTLFNDRLVGAPTKPGTFAFTLRASGAGQTAQRAFTMEVSAEPLAPTVTTASLPDGTLGRPYSTQLRAMRGDGNYSWAVVAGELPPGLTMASTGEISGVPSAIGEFAFNVEVTSAGMTGETDLEIAVGYPPVAIDLHLLDAAKLGEPYTETLQASGGDGVNYKWSVVSGALPPGLSLGPATGTISGTPTAEGFFTFTLEIASGGRISRQSFYINVYAFELLVLENWYLPVAIQGTPYSGRIAVSGGESGDYQFRVIGGGLPPSLSLDPRTGVITGTTSGTAGTFYFNVEVEEGTQKAARSYSLTVSSVGRDGFNIAVMNVSNRIPPADFIPAIDQAVRKWESIITSDFPSFTMPADLEHAYCQGHGNKLRKGDVIEDFVILLGVYNIDGVYGVVGQAGPCGYAIGDPILFPSGSFVMDESDLPSLSPGQRVSVALHEIGHALGIGTLWDIGGRTLIAGKGDANPRYVGSAGVAAYKALGGRDTDVAVENEGGAGSRDGHWREYNFDNELMTSFLAPPQVAMPLSLMTVMSLQDLGYEVNPDAADPYTVPFRGGNLTDGASQEERIELRGDRVIEPFIRVLPNGSLRVEQRR